MASLYDRLKRAKPLPQNLHHDDSTASLMVQERCLKLSENIPEQFSGHTLDFLGNGWHQINCKKQDVLFLDTETTGLSRGAGTLAFLVGLGQIDKDRLRITQIMLRDYHQEPELLSLVNEKVKKALLLVTYNGAVFDLPLIESRMVLNRIKSDLSEIPHLDLLHAARRVYKMRLGRCPLTRLEEIVLGFTRQDDLPGSMVPARFFEYLKTRQESLLYDVLNHNCLDIHSLARLMAVLYDLHEQPLKTTHQMDLLSLGKVFERRGEAERAMTCYKACSEKTVRQLALLRLAELYRKKRMDQEAVGAFENLRSISNIPVKACISLAKVYEHRFRDYERALEITKQGMIYCSERPGFCADFDQDYQDLSRRSLRLMRKAERKSG